MPNFRSLVQVGSRHFKKNWKALRYWDTPARDPFLTGGTLKRSSSARAEDKNHLMKIVLANSLVGTSTRWSVLPRDKLVKTEQSFWPGSFHDRRSSEEPNEDADTTPVVSQYVSSTRTLWMSRRILWNWRGRLWNVWKRKLLSSKLNRANTLPSWNVWRSLYCLFREVLLPLHGLVQQPDRSCPMYPVWPW